MITILIGHRGTGKTSLLRRLEVLFSNNGNVHFKDLDDEIETMHRRSINSIFESSGEAEFRRLEGITFQSLIKNAPAEAETYIAVGAGFEFYVPDHVHVVWVRRPTDVNGRIFFQRPKLSNTDPMTEWKTRFEQRDPRYRRLAKEELTLPEGGLHDKILEEHFFKKPARPLPYALTALPEDFRSGLFFERRKNWGLKWVEVRDDLLREDEIAKLREVWPAEQLLYSVRKTPIASRPAGFGAVDWPLEMGQPPLSVDILSLHEREPDFAATLRKANAHGSAIFKLAVEVHSFSELLLGHRWWLENPSRRSFLPRSADGRWQWYRQLFGPRMPLHFFREGDGTSPDQPYLWQTLIERSPDKGFAAILGSPVRQSWTPAFQREFFEEHAVPVVAVLVNEAEYSEALPVLTEIGLRYAAVTSPLKRLAFQTAAERTDSARRFESVNTLAWTKHGWVGENTDIFGAQILLQDFMNTKRPTIVWGGGGTRAILKTCLPDAELISARTGKTLTEPVCLVWAVGNGREFVWPKPLELIDSVIDLNYSMDSPGREIAQRTGRPYKTGESMFIHQALRQRDFWKRYL